MNKNSLSFAASLVWPLALLTCVMTFLLLIAGALVVGTGSSLSVPDWPLSFGRFFPPMRGGVFYEHGHRLIAGTVGLMTVGLAVLISFYEKRRWVVVLAWVAVVSVFLQALLGGLTVLYQLPALVSVAHACLAQMFFCLVCLIVLSLSSWWTRAGGTLEVSSRWLHRQAVLTCVLFFGQLFLGALMRHLGAGLAIPDFPTAFGAWVPPLDSFPVAVHFAHRLGACIVLLASVYLAVRLSQTGSFLLGVLSGVLLMLLVFQVTLGALTIWMERPVWVTTAHLAIGALCFALSFLMTVLLFHLRKKTLSKATAQGSPNKLSLFWELSKPRLTAMALAMTALGFAWAQMKLAGFFPWFEFWMTLLGTAFVGGGAAALNQYIERDLDGKMARTRLRPLPTGQLSPKEALGFGAALSVMGVFILLVFVNAITAVLGALTLFFYLGLYTPSKRMSSASTLVGAIPGALPPLMGWTAGYGQLSLEGIFLFDVLFLWQVPHFLSIAWIYRDEYANGRFFVLSVNDPGGEATVQQALLYALALVSLTMLPAIWGVVGAWYMVGALGFGILFLVSIFQLMAQRTRQRARRVFLASIVYLPALSLLIILDSQF